MRAKFVYESISFERGRDPKAVLGIGIGPGELADEAIRLLPEILRRDEIPENIIRSKTYVMKPEYLSKVDKWLARKFGYYCDRHGNFWKSKESHDAGDPFTDFDSIAGFNTRETDSFYQALHKGLKAMGYEDASEYN